ncbi:MAG TPA: hypothetical protein VGN29_01165 [Solirubrobacteraceae bacterium]|nr:hypothetical protein [Solirubrobacteraceae bacterium]
MSVPSAELTAPSARADARAAWPTLTARVTPGRLYLVMGAVALALAALSLLIPSTPSYDPWAWIVWGREIAHVNLQTTGGPTWKPLPLIFTTVFSLFGKAAPDLWLVVGRAGALMAVAMVFKMCVRLTRQLAVRGDADEARSSALGPAILAGLVAAFGLTFAGGFITSSALGYSEGLMTALVLIAVDRHLDGCHRQAFAVGFAAALDRPEIWLFWGPYGLWLFWKDPGARKLVIALFALIPILWFLPEYWGSGHFFRGVTRAHTPRSNSAAFAKCPFCTEFAKHAWPTVPSRTKGVAIIAGLAAAIGLWRAFRAGGRAALATPRRQAMAGIAIAAALGFGWWVVISVMTQIGFSGNDRYLILGAALVEIAGGVGFGWAALELSHWLSRRYSAGSRRLASGVGTWAVAAAIGACFLLLPQWIGGLVHIRKIHKALVYQAHLREDLTKAVAQVGGPARVLRCGSVMTEGFQVPMVAWALGVHTLQIEAPPNGGPPPPAPNVIFRTRAQRNATPLPLLSDWPNVHFQRVGHVRTFSVYSNCTGNVTL